MDNNKTTKPAISSADKLNFIQASDLEEHNFDSSNNARGNIIHVYDDTERNPNKFDWAEKIWIPVGLGVIGLAATVMGGIFGVALSSLQEDNAKADRLIERANAASSSRQAVLTNYASRITDLISEKGAMEFDDDNPEKVAIWNAMRGELI